MESEAVVLDSDLSTGDKVSIANVMTKDDLRFSSLLLPDDLLRKYKTIKVIATVNGIGFILYW